MSTATAERPILPTAKKQQRVTRKFRLLVGSHVQTDPEFANLTSEELVRRAIEKGILVTDPTWPNEAVPREKIPAETLKRMLTQQAEPTIRSDLLRQLGAERVYDAGEVIEQVITHNWCAACRSKYPLGVTHCTRCKVGDPENPKPRSLEAGTLDVMFGRNKFEGLDSREVVREVVREVIRDRPVILDAMNVQELREYAEANEIELPEGADTKQKMMQAIVVARKQQ